MNKPLPSTDLSTAFAKPSRGAGIQLPPTRKPPQKRSQARQRSVSSVPDPAPTEDLSNPQIPAEKPQSSRAPATEQRPRAAKPPSTRRTAAGKAPGTIGRPQAGQGRLVLWTPVSIRARMQAVQSSTGALYLDQVLDALEATVDRLPDLVAETTEQPHIQGKLFERAVATPEASPPRVQLTIRGVLDSQLAVIDQLVESSGARSRSALINAALEATLPA